MDNHNKFEPSWGYIWGIRLLVAGAIISLVIAWLVGYYWPNILDRPTFVTVNTLAIVAFVVTIITAFTNRETARIMNRQELEAGLQRKAAEDAVKLTEKIVKEMQAQRELAEHQVAQSNSQVILMHNQVTQMIGQSEVMQRQLDMGVRNECAYFVIKNWELPQPINNELVVTGTFFNGGRTPAWNFTRQFQIEVGSGMPPTGYRDIAWNRKTQLAPVSIIIAGGETNFTTDPMQLKPETVTDIITGVQVVLIDGECIYSDVTGCKWAYRFGYTFEAHTLSPKAVERYQTHEKYNPN